MTYKYIIKHTKKGRVSRVEVWNAANFREKTHMGVQAVRIADALKLEPIHEWVEGVMAK